ncbi:MAG: hypothetical protein RI944_199 [Actinomycetota bacterium]|jgi:uncharacterized protein YdhG (YjbR/CyaY superfamily)
MTKILIDKYLKNLPEPQKSTLIKLRKTIKKIEPKAKEVISYNIPAFKIDEGIICGFFSAKKHCSYFPFSGKVLPELKEELKDFDQSTGTLRFAVDKPLSEKLVRKLISVRKKQLKLKQIKK